MDESLTGFLAGSSSQEERYIEVLRCFYAGYLTISEYHRLISLYELGGMDTLANVENILENDASALPVAVEGETVCLSGTPMRRFVFDIEEARELSRGKTFFDVWKMRLDSPEGYAVPYRGKGVSLTDSWYTVHGYEEYGLNRINKYLVSRTCKKYAVIDGEVEKKKAQTLEDVVVIFPDMQEAELAKKACAIVSMDGGFAFKAIGPLMPLMDNMRTKYNCPARFAFVVRRFDEDCAEVGR